MKKSLRTVIPFDESYLCEVDFTAMGVLNMSGSFTTFSKIRLTSENMQPAHDITVNHAHFCLLFQQHFDYYTFLD